jgi:hypothetical protein
MRLFTVGCAVLFVSSLASGQTSPIPGYVGYGYGPYVPMVTTPEISLQSRPTGPAVGATNATGGLQAGARNSTLEMGTGNEGAEYTQPVWYSGGTTPEISRPSVQLPVQGAGVHPMMRMEHMMMEREHAAAPKAWTYFGAEEVTPAAEASASAKTGKRATRTITNQDIDQENQKTGTVKYDGKTETIK